jgi:transcriptional regulator NrdR family protein
MICTKCKIKLSCTKTYPHEDYTRRLYKCSECGKAYSTMERFMEQDVAKPIPVASKAKTKTIDNKLTYAEIHWRLHHPGQPYEKF